MKNQVQLITYADRLSGNLKQLKASLKGPLADLFGGVHLLPFFNPIDGADAGFDPENHTEVDPRLGNWDDVRALGDDFEIVADLIDGVIPDQRIFPQLRGAANFVSDITSSWQALDRWSNANLQFFHEIPSVPTSSATIPLDFFNQEKAELDQIVAQASDVKMKLVAKEGETI